MIIENLWFATKHSSIECSGLALTVCEILLMRSVNPLKSEFPHIRNPWRNSFKSQTFDEE